MRIAILGTGNMGRAFAMRLAGTAHEVSIGSRDPAAHADAAVGPNEKVVGMREAVDAGDVVIAALPGTAAPDILRELGDFGGKVLLDHTNPLGEGLSLAIGWDTSLAERIQEAVPGARVVKAFNYVFASVLRGDADLSGESPTVMYCGDDDQAKRTVRALIEELGFDAADAGPLRSARYLEPLAALLITKAYILGEGPAQSVRIIHA